MLLARPEPVADFAEYLELGRGLLASGRLGDPCLTAYRLPGYPALLALLLSAGSGWAWLGLVNAALSATIAPLAYKLALGLHPENRLPALGAGLLCAINPTFVFFGPLLASENLFVPSLMLGLWILVRFTRRPVAAAAIAGICLSTATLTRGEGLFYLPVFLAGAAFAGKSLAQRIAAPGALLLVLALALSPWLARNEALFGSGAGLSTSGGVNFYYAHNDSRYGWYPFEESELADREEGERHRRGLELGIEALREGGAKKLFEDTLRGSRELYLTGGHYSIFWSTRIPGDRPRGDFEGRPVHGQGLLRALISPFYVALLPLLALSLALWRRWRTRVLWMLIGLISMNWLCYAVVFWGKARYRYVSELVFCILAGAALGLWAQSLRKRRLSV